MRTSTILIVGKEGNLDGSISPSTVDLVYAWANNLLAGYEIARMVQKFDGMDSSDPNNAELHQYSITTAPINVFIRFHEAEK